MMNKNKISSKVLISIATWMVIFMSTYIWNLLKNGFNNSAFINALGIATLGTLIIAIGVYFIKKLNL
ncbi:hypothetical protein ACNAN0_01445 [Agrilactobacillus fermenti]|uniref:hypothetical protein n=1 Tax=Agrilactobacillus fermenti TaxID=2586909 RepID=UPI001E607793|nr:hypothetical protein [Agrilactobacillus fermenti]